MTADALDGDDRPPAADGTQQCAPHRIRRKWTTDVRRRVVPRELTVTSKALVVRGGWEGHQPVKATELFLPFLERSGYAVRIEESTEVYADAAEMADTDLVVQCVTMSQITADQVAGLSAAVEAGTGLTGWHGGIADSLPRLLRLPASGRRPVRRPTRARSRASGAAARRTTSCRTR